MNSDEIPKLIKVLHRKVIQYMYIVQYMAFVKNTEEKQGDERSWDYQPW